MSVALAPEPLEAPSSLAPSPAVAPAHAPTPGFVPGPAAPAEGGIGTVARPLAPLAGRLRRLARAHPVAAAGTLLVLASAAVPAALASGGPLRLALDGEPAPGVRLATPAAYVAISPLARAADALCLLSTEQHVALAATLLLLVLAWRVARRCPRASALRTCAHATGACGASLALLVLALAGAVFAPRPMASIAVADPDEVRVDFHAHTNASHDVAAWFTPARRRAWHQAAGFDLAYVSDHRSTAGALAAARRNPARAGDGLVVLPAIESWWHRVHLVVLGRTALDPALLADDQLHRAMPAALASGRLAGAPAPVAIAAIPDQVLRVLTPAGLARAPWIRGVEVADGAPRALAQVDREGGAIAERAATLGILPLAGTNHHGWGRTALAWNLVRVPGWRRMTPAELGTQVEGILRRGDRGAVRVVERARPEVAPAGVRRLLSLAATLPAVVWRTAAELGAAERLVWLVWLWSPAMLALLWRHAGRVRGRRGHLPPTAGAVDGAPLVRPG